MTSPGSLNDAKSAYYTSYGYTGSVADMEYQYYSGVPVLDSMGMVRTAAPTASTLIGTSVINGGWYYRIVEGGTISAIRMYVSTQSGNMSLGLYNNIGSGLNAKPNTRYATTGSILVPAAPAVTDFPLGGSYKVAAGDWMHITLDNTTARFSGAVGVGDGSMNAGIYAAETAFPSPAVSTASGPANNRLFAMVGIP